MLSRLMNCKSATQMKPHARYKHSPLRWACCHRQRGRKSEREGVHTRTCDGGIMDASSPPDSLGYVRMTNSLRNNSFDWFVEERKLVMLPRIKLLLGLVLNFIKWISEKRIHIHFRPKSWIIKRIYNCTLFSPQAQPAKISYVHVTGYFMFFSETVRSELNQVCCMWVWITAWPPEHTERQTENSVVPCEGSCRCFWLCINIFLVWFIHTQYWIRTTIW